MGTDVRCFFAPVAAEETPQDLDAACEIVGMRYDRKEETGLRTSLSRNGWQLASLCDAASKRSSSSLDFLKTDFALLDARQTAAALAVLAEILAEASEGLDGLATTATDAASDALLAISLDEDPVQFEARSAMRAAYLEAEPSHDVEWTGDAGYGALIGYFAFLKSLASCLLECLQKGKRLLFCKVG